jgi:hypothetical protein
MRYVEFRNAIMEELVENRAGLTWAELKERLSLPYRQPCPEWVKRMEVEDGLSRARGVGRAFVWSIRPEYGPQARGGGQT